jgi:hypothetical protein
VLMFDTLSFDSLILILFRKVESALARNSILRGKNCKIQLEEANFVLQYNCEKDSTVITQYPSRLAEIWFIVVPWYLQV